VQILRERERVGWRFLPAAQEDGDSGACMEFSVKSRASVSGAAALFLSVSLAPIAAGQHVVEVRGADTKYRFADWNYTFRKGPVMDVFYVGVPGSNEVNAGGGYAFKRGGLVVTPLVCGVIGMEGARGGVKVALLISVDKAGWKLLSFLGDYLPISGAVESYLVLDTLDFTRAIGRRWELGVQAGFSKIGDAWNPQIGPLVKFNDRLGAWAASYRFGPNNEFRVGRVRVLPSKW
jgi:hypothetical protein